MRIVDSEFPNNDDEIALSKLTAEYVQNLDCVQSSDDYMIDYQSLTITTDDGGAGKFIRIRTEDTGWSISDVDELVTIINDFKNRLKCQITLK